ncbi:MAG: hypothetical protein J1E97_02875 [Muribaculaceae bacterium]|nr:hypothetical protein [Muribaculaceae bacterium]
MNKILRAITIVGNLSEIIIATSLVVDLCDKIRGKKKATTTVIDVEENLSPQPELNPAA